MSIRNAVLAAAILAAAAPAAMAEQTITKNAKVAPDATVDISNVQGRVEITAWDKNEVDLLARLESSKDELEFVATDRSVRIEVKRPKGKYQSDTDDAFLTIRVPKGARVITDTVSADIGVTGVQGEQRLQSVSGDVKTQAFDSPVKATAVSGDITITGNGGKATVTTESVSGNSTVSGVRGSYSAEVVSGDIHATVAAADRIELTSVSGDADLSVELVPASRLTLESVSGSMAVRIKPPVNADFDLESFSGDIENCFGQNAHDKNKYGPGSELNFTQGSGGARIEIETISGEISVCDR